MEKRLAKVAAMIGVPDDVGEILAKKGTHSSDHCHIRVSRPVWVQTTDQDQPLTMFP